MSGAEVASLIGAINTRDDRDSNDFGENWIWIIGLLIIAGIFGGGSWFGGNRGTATMAANDSLLGEEFIKRDIFNTNQNVSNSACQTQRDVLENRYALGTGILENRFNCSQNACGTQKEVLQNRYDNALQVQTLSSQIAQCCLTKVRATIREILCRFKNLIFGELLEH